VEAGDDSFAAQGHTRLVGGEAAQHVGSDQDPKKMDLQDILRKYGE
jgi:hypothetical protein